MKKKILFIITKSNWGGAQRYVYDLATSLPSDSFDCAVVLGGNGVLKEKLEKKSIRTISLSSLQRNINIQKEFLSFKDLFLILKKERPDIIHVNSSKAAGIGAFSGRLLGIKKIVFTAHAWAFNEDRNVISRFVIAFFHWLTVILAHQTIAVSDAVKNQVSHLPFLKNKITVIYPGINPPSFIDRQTAQRELGIDNEKNKVLLVTIAELHRSKGLTYAVDALYKIKEDRPDLIERIQYFLIGEGEEREKLENQIKERKLGSNITLMGFKKDASLYLKAFDFFLLPSLSEAFGYVLLEAGSAELPVLASNVGGIPEIIEDEINGKLFPPKEAEAIKDSLEEAIRDQFKYKEMSLKLKERIGAHFAQKIMVDNTLLIYFPNML